MGETSYCFCYTQPMKRINQFGFSSPLIVLIIVILAAIGFTAWQLMKSNDAQPVAKMPTTSEVNNSCGSDRQCFYQAFNSDCMQKTIKTTLITIEGDPIVTTAKVAQGLEGCIVEVTVDGSQDEFGEGKVHSYTCDKLAEEGQTLIANECMGTGQTSNVVI